MHFEIVTHCYHYSRLLTYQLSSFVLCPPPDGIRLTVTVYYSQEDTNTVSTLEWFGKRNVKNLQWNFRRIKLCNILKRAIGRNHAARKTKADWIWYTDADHFFLEDVWERLADAVGNHPLLFSSRTRCCHTHAVGDKYIFDVKPGRFHEVQRRDFFLSTYNKAVGASQIVRGDVAREHGYMPSKHWQKSCRANVTTFQQCHSDMHYRREMLAKIELLFKPIFIQNVYRLRHSSQGRNGMVEL